MGQCEGGRTGLRATGAPPETGLRAIGAAPSLRTARVKICIRAMADFRYEATGHLKAARMWRCARARPHAALASRTVYDLAH